MNENELKMEVQTTAGNQIAVIDQQTYEAAGKFLLDIKATAKRVKDFFADMKAQAAAAHKAICNKENEHLKPLEEAERQLKSKMVNYYNAEQLRIRAEEDRKRKEAEEMAALAIQAEQSGDTEFAAEAMATAAIQAATVTLTPKATGCSYRKVWRHRVTDIQAVPREYMIVNDAALSALAKAFKDSPATTIPGVEFYSETVLSGRIS